MIVVLTPSAEPSKAEEPAPEESEKKKKKKRKREEQEEPEPSTSESKKEKKDKKKRRKDDAAPSTSAESSSAPSKAPTPAAKSVASPADAAAFLSKHSITITTPDGVPAVVPITDFAQLDVPAALSASFKGFKEPTPIQACTWPPALEGRDVVGIAETGRCAACISFRRAQKKYNTLTVARRSPLASLR